MSKHQYVYSKLASDNAYTGWRVADGGKAPHQVQHQVMVNGGAGVADKALRTPLGVVTRVSAEDAEFLKANTAFLRHQKRGFVKMEESELPVEKVVSTMESARDKSDQITETDVVAAGDKAPTTGKNKKK